MDGQATTVDNAEPLSVIDRVHEELVSTPWISSARVRVRDMGHVFSVGARIAPSQMARSLPRTFRPSCSG